MQVGRRRGDALVVRITTQPGGGKRGGAWHRVCFGVQWGRCVTHVTALEEEKMAAPTDVRPAAGERAGRERGGLRVAVQKLGAALSNMVLPNIAAFIAWGLITALFIEAGWITLVGGDLFGYTDRK